MRLFNGRLLGLALSAGSPALLNLLVPRGGYSLQRDLAYGGEARQRLDVYAPQEVKAPAPVLVFFHGGSWQMGSKDWYRALGQAFASKGIVTVVADYRLYPPARFPAFVEDGALAFRYVREQIARYGGDPERIFLTGHSAGAYIAVMLAANTQYLHAAKADPEWIRGVVGIAGPYDFLPLVDSNLIQIFGGDRVAATQPIHFIDGRKAPMLLVHGTADKTVLPGNTRRLAARLTQHQSPVEVIEYPGIGHLAIILSLVPGFRGMTTLREDMLRFVKANSE